MVIGIPKGLLYYKYHIFIESYLQELGAEIIVSPDTNKDILDEGARYCVDEACLPIKVFHGHVAWLKNRCDVIIVPRIMQLKKREYICPKFCGLPEMIKNSIPGLPKITEEPIYASSSEELFKWATIIGKILTEDRSRIKKAFDTALDRQKEHKSGVNNGNFSIKVALLGHPYNIYDNFCNMNIIRKLNSNGIGVITEEFIDEKLTEAEIKKLFKKPFWTFGRNSYGAAAALFEKSAVDGIVYISSFACGIDSVLLELIKEKIKDFPMLVLKLDEHSGEAGLDTRVEAFADMLGRRLKYENKYSESRKHISCS
jgi:predicted nucleotide-binding protein (sugar kinase/HSP70/actin superfamily)